MGVIKKQSILTSIISYLGVAIGTISTLFIYPKDETTYGLFRFLLDTANVLIPFAFLGMPFISIKFFAYFNDVKKGDRGLLGFTFLVSMIGFLLSGFIIYFYKFNLINVDTLKDKYLFIRYSNYIIFFLFCYGFFSLLRQYVSNFQQVALPTALDQTIKITFPILLLFYIWGYLTLNGVLNGVVLHFILISSILLFYLINNNRFNLSIDTSLLDSATLKSIAGYAGYSVLATGGGMLALRIDTFMVSTMMGSFEKTGDFSINTLIASNIMLPFTAISGVATPIIAKAWHNNDLNEIRKIYVKSSEILLIVGLFLFGGVILCIDDIYAIMQKKGDLEAGKIVVTLIGLKCVIDMATGLNDGIIGFSRYYRFGLYAISIMAIVNIAFNLFLIPSMGTIGVAIATFIASVAFNLSKFIFIYKKFDIVPFSSQSLKTLLIALVCFTITYIIPNNLNHILNILIKGSIFAATFGTLTIYLQLSEDINQLFTQVKSKFLK